MKTKLTSLLTAGMIGLEIVGCANKTQPEQKEEFKLNLVGRVSQIRTGPTQRRADCSPLELYIDITNTDASKLFGLANPLLDYSISDTLTVNLKFDTCNFPRNYPPAVGDLVSFTLTKGFHPIVGAQRMTPQNAPRKYSIDFSGEGTINSYTKTR
jgi:hypothetical protein